MPSKLLRRGLPVVAALLLLLPAAASAQFDSVGSLDFPTSARSAEAQQHFLRGVAILHSFGWKQAIEQFQAAQEIEPDFVMAYWGETLCYNHPLFRSDPDDENPRAALARLGATTAERLAKAPTARERGFLEAVEALWADGDYNERRVDYMHAMERLHGQFPDDHEVATFYALSLLSGSPRARRSVVTPGDAGRRDRAGCVRGEPEPSRRAPLRDPCLRRPHPRAAGAAVRAAVREDCPRGGPRPPHADAHLHPARHVGPRLRAQPVRVRRGPRPLESR